MRRDVFSLHESVTWPCWIESGLLKEIKLTSLPVVHGLICLIIDDDDDDDGEEVEGEGEVEDVAD